jgi:hypothetical protein
MTSGGAKAVWTGVGATVALGVGSEVGGAAIGVGEGVGTGAIRVRRAAS